jgi:signal transduction histidine kinase
LKNVSISLRLTFWLSAIFLAGFILFGAIVWVDLAYSLSKGRDRTLARRAVRFADLLATTRDDSAARRAYKLEELAEVIPEGNLIQIIDPSGKRLFPPVLSPPDFPWPLKPASSHENYSDLDYGGRIFRLYQLPVAATPPEVILVAGQLEDNRNLMSRLTIALVWAILAMLALSAFGGYFLSRRVLRPVDQITGALRVISIGNLSRRLPISGTGDELERLAETCNQMLGRLENAVERINRFTADASHELRGPVALIRTVSEYALQNPAIEKESRESFTEILAEAMEAGCLLEDMLTLARADAGCANTAFEFLNLTELVDDVCARMRLLADLKHQTIFVRTPGRPVSVNGDASSIRRLLSILIDNAVKYTPDRGRIEVELSAPESKIMLTVRDTGIGIPQDLLPRIFDRFVRADPSRGEVSGTGLGLAIAKWIAGTHDATISVESREREGSVFTVELPLGAGAANARTLGSFGE